MTQSVKSSTVEAFAKNAGLGGINGNIIAVDGQFEVYTEMGIFIAKFREGDVPVAKFYKTFDDGSVKFLTREEASDLMDIIQSIIVDPEHTRTPLVVAYTHLRNNLPNLGFSKDTPYMTEKKTAQNARNWTWELR